MGKLRIWALQLAVCMIGVPWLADATVLWHDDLNITASVFNEDIDISGTNELKNRIRVVSSTSDVVVTVTTNDSVVTSSLQLHLFAAESHIITFSLQHDLMLRGSRTDFLITYSGEGQLRFWIKGQNALRITSSPTSGGAQFYVIQNATVNPADVLFSRFPLGSFPLAESDLNSYIQVGPRSLISFAAPNSVASGLANEFGTIGFDATNYSTSVGRLVLQIENGGSFVITGHQINNLITPTISDIEVTIPAGQEADAEIINSGAGAGNWSGLLVVNKNKTWNQLQIDPFCEGSFTKIQQGFVLGANGALSVDNLSYLDYVVTVTNITLDPQITPTVLNYPCERFVDEIIKDRNPAALIVDGNLNSNSIPAKIRLDGNSAIYFRSGVDCNGISTISTATVLADQNVTFTIGANKNHTETEGAVLLDVEGLLNVEGSVTGQNVLNVLSLQVAPVGGSVLIEGSDTVFPLRTFAKDANGAYLQYGVGSFLINNRMNLINTDLQHTDNLHRIFENNIAGQSSPTYIGGESRTLGCGFGAPQNNIAFHNSTFLLHTSAAATGVDFLVPNTESGNLSFIKAYYNGRCIDQGTGRQLILGTNVGALASDLAHIINRDSHLDVIQTTSGLTTDQVLTLTVAPNNTKVTEGITGNINNQFSVHTIFLGNASNISIGTNGTVGTGFDGSTFSLTTFPQMLIDGDFFSFTTQGGTLKRSDLSMTTAEGGMFVDTNGTIDIASNRRAAFGMVVTKSRNGSIILPKNQVFFVPGIGLAQWHLDLSDATQLEVVGPNQNFSDYTIDWQNITKDYCTVPVNVPYELANVPLAGASPAVTPENLIGLPMVRGAVDQMQMENSRIGDQAQLVVDGGLIRELTFLPGEASGTAPTGFLVVQNDAIVGLGAALRNVNSLRSSVVLGINGVTLVANGNATIRLNDDALINNVSHILAGPSFGQTIPQQLLLESEVSRELRVKSDGVLDLTQFTTANQKFVIGGQVRLILEPGAKVLLGGGDLIFTDQAQMRFSPFVDGDLPTGTTTAATDDFRTKFIGNGRVIFEENAQMFLPRGAYVGVETDPVLNFDTTNQSWILNDAGIFAIGTPEEFGGSFQVGNVEDVAGHTINFSLIVDGIGTLVDLNSQGFLGFGMGIVDKQAAIPNAWRIDRLFNVNSVTLALTQGTFRNQQTYTGADINAALLALGPLSADYTFSFDRNKVEILGGGNMIAQTDTTSGFFNPVIGTVDGVVTPRISVGIMGSKATLFDTSKNPTGSSPVVVNGTVADMYGFLKMNPYAEQLAGKTAALFRNAIGGYVAGFIHPAGTINRLENLIVQSGGIQTNINNALAIGAAGIKIAQDGTPALYVINP